MDNKGFTLVEIAIVIVIIGLILAGVVSGQDLIKQAQIRSVINNINKYNTAINTFTIKYHGVPGDLLNAHEFWGSDCDSTAANCNGDGSRLVEWVATAGQNSNLENLRAWQHLSLAGLVNASYTGVYAYPTFINVTMPPASVDGGCYSYLVTGTTSTTYTGRFGSMKNGLYIGKPSLVADYQGRLCSAPLFEPIEAYSIDLKVDDALPNSGSMQVRTAETTGCIGANQEGDDSSANDDPYNLDNEGVHCNLIFQTQ
ncbi:prepilin-type N-terminal cleavage/methylation domain-containing protein [Rickettsiales bacterium]|nr:prepilin-type N-terminal cleavage/methylation domain-containing protein [Rickettsiales bacterium]